VTAILTTLLLFAAPFEAFDAPLNPVRWYVGAVNKPKSGRLKIAKGGWIATRELGDIVVQRFEIRFRHAGGELEIAFCNPGEPLSRPVGEPIVIAKKKGDRVFVISPIGVHVDGEPIHWKGQPTGCFRLKALRGSVEIDSISIAPAPEVPPEPSRLERDTLFLMGLPPALHADGQVFRRVTLTLWDAEVAFLFRRGAASGSVEPFAAAVKGAPLLGHRVVVSDGKAWTARAATHELAMADWGDERTNLSGAEYQRYLNEEYARFELLMAAQHVMLQALPEKRRKACEPLSALAAIRHSANSRAALALAETLGRKKAVAAVRKELGANAGRRRVSSDDVRNAAAKAARRILGDAPPEWPGFAFDPQSRVVTLEQTREILR